MMDFVRVLALASLVVLLGACSRRTSEPPPPAASAAVPQAAPNARGSMMAGNVPVPGLVGPRHSDDEEEDPGAPPEPTIEPPAPEEEAPLDSGVTL